MRTFAAGKPITVRHASSPLLSKHNEFFMVASGIVRLEVVGETPSGGAGTRSRSTTMSTSDHTGFYTAGDFFPRELLKVDGDPEHPGGRVTKLVATARTEVQCVVFNEYEFWRFLMDKNVLASPSTMAYAQSERTVRLNAVLASLTTRQQKAFRAHLEPALVFDAGEELWGVGSPATQGFLVESGTCSVTSSHGDAEPSSYVACHVCVCVCVFVLCVAFLWPHLYGTPPPPPFFLC